jgi:RDD family protein
VLLLVFGLVFSGGGLAGSIGAAVLIVVVGASWIGYFLICEWRWGLTAGKRALRARVVTEYGAPIGFADSVTRNLLRIVDFLPFMYLLGGILAITSARSQRLGDRAAGTLVVRPPKKGNAVAVPPGASFVQLTSLEHTALTGTAVGELSAVIDEFQARKQRLLHSPRQDLAARIAAQAERVVDRPPGLDDETYIEYARRTIRERETQ